MNAVLKIDRDHPAFAGHFPGIPILPGAVLLDEALHEIAISRHLDLRRWRVAGVKFLDIIRPGDVLTLEHSAPDESTIRFAVRSSSRQVASGTLSATGAATSQRDGNGG